MDKNGRGECGNATREEPIHDRSNKSGVREISEKDSEVNLSCDGTPFESGANRSAMGPEPG